MYDKSIVGQLKIGLNYYTKSQSKGVQCDFKLRGDNEISPKKKLQLLFSAIKLLQILMPSQGHTTIPARKYKLYQLGVFTGWIGSGLGSLDIRINPIPILDGRVWSVQVGFGRVGVG